MGKYHRKNVRKSDNTNFKAKSLRITGLILAGSVIVILLLQKGKVLYFENLDLENVVTPVDDKQLECFLRLLKYDIDKSQFLVRGFTQGFNIDYNRKQKVKLTTPNLTLQIFNRTILWNKVMKEIKEKRYAGPLEKIPFKDDYIQSTIGLVPKGEEECRLIFHLSHPWNTGDSVNANTSKEQCTEGISCMPGKSDLSAAFSNLGIIRKHWYYLILKAKKIH